MTSGLDKGAGFGSICVLGGEELDAQGGIHVPLYNHSTFGFPSTAALLDVAEGRKEGNLYRRYGLNLTVRAVERKLVLLEGGELAFVFNSGMAAETATFLSSSLPVASSPYPLGCANRTPPPRRSRSSCAITPGWSRLPWFA